MRYSGIQAPEEFRIITRAQVIGFRDELIRRGLKSPAVRRKLGAEHSSARPQPAGSMCSSAC
jgi:hypothetical protein